MGDRRRIALYCSHLLHQFARVKWQAVSHKRRLGTRSTLDKFHVYVGASSTFAELDKTKRRYCLAHPRDLGCTLRLESACLERAGRNLERLGFAKRVAID